MNPIKLTDIRTTTQLPVEFSHRGLTYTLSACDSSWGEYRLECVEYPMDYPAASLADVREMVRVHSGAWHELNSEPLVITRECQGRTRVMTKQPLESLSQAIEALQLYFSRARSTGHTAYLAADKTAMRLDTNRMPVYYRIEPASLYA